MLHLVGLAGSVPVPAPTQLQRVKNSIKREPQQRAEIYIFSNSLSIFKEPRAVTPAPQPAGPSVGVPAQKDGNYLWVGFAVRDDT